MATQYQRFTTITIIKNYIDNNNNAGKDLELQWLTNSSIHAYLQNNKFNYISGTLNALVVVADTASGKASKLLENEPCL